MRSRVKILAAVIIVAGLGTGIFAYARYKNFSERLIKQLDSQTGQTLGRRLKFRKIGFSPLKGVVIAGLCVSRAPDFSKGTFFCADRIVLRPEIAPLMRNRLRFAEVELVSPVINIREKDGKWDFEDLLALLPKTSKGLYLTWNVKKLALTGAKVEADLSSSGRSFSLENADITLLHYSGLAGNFSLQLSGALKTVLKGQLLTSGVSLKTDLNFEYAGLTAAFGGTEFTGASLGAATLKRAALSWELFNMDLPTARKNYSARLTAEKLFVPEQSCGLSAAVNAAMGTLSSVMGKETPAVKDVELENLTLDLALRDGTLRVKRLSMNTSFLDAETEYELNGTSRSVSIRFAARTGRNKLDLTASGPMDNPRIAPAMCATLNRKLTGMIRGINSALLKIFPVTHEATN
jgi:uncharacterized protein involved in outer membrane biogenesis